MARSRELIVRESSLIARDFSRDFEKKLFSLFVTVHMFKEKMTKERLASYVGCTPRAIGYYLTGDRVPGLTIASEIFKALNLDSNDYLVFKKSIQAQLDIF